MTARERRSLSLDGLRDRRGAEMAYLSALKILTKTQEDLKRAVAGQMALMQTAVPGAQESLYVLGPSGTGKSTAVLEAAFRVYRDSLEKHGQVGVTDPVLEVPGWSHDLIPVIWANIRSDASGKAAVGQIRSFLLDGEPRGTAWQITNELPKVLPRHGVSLVVLDDVHNLGTRGKNAEEVLMTLKNLQTDLGLLRIAFVYLGNADSKTGEYNLSLHDQLSQRLIPYQVDHFDLDQRDDSAPQNVAWVDYLLQWEEALVHLLPDLQRGDLAAKAGFKLWTMTKGSPGALIGILKRYTRDLLLDEPPRSLGVDRSRLLATPATFKYSSIGRGQ
ncbi:hypothetical protein CFH99_24395 [Nocardioides aromaticivorans]|uniref:AAA+ ATPase domain-containing protein n=2 Tax=Nocardioides aromaticivorans TaxID=200618 RepID=A0ABX7PS63_9ACTN|nr:hypothetical protein CFH99_24395 [Nocardioides aromaticivorans]